MLTLSLHTFQLLGVTLVSALFAGMSAYGVSRLASASNSKSTSLALWATGASILLDAAAGVRYLSEQRVQLADR